MTRHWKVVSLLSLGLAVACTNTGTEDDGAGGQNPGGGSPTTGGTGGTGGAAGGAGGATGGMGGTGGGDTTAPSPVSDLAAAANDGTNAIDVSWTNPSDGDLAGVLIVASATGNDVTFTPTDGTTYNADDEPVTDETVVASAAGTTAALTPPTPGLRYSIAAWAYDDALNYSTIELTDGVKNSLGSQTAQVSIDDQGAVTITTQPANFTLAATASVAGTDVTIDLGVTNDTARLVFNTKLVATNMSDGTFDGDGDTAGETFPTGMGNPYSYYGPEAMDLATEVTRTIGLSDVNTFPVTFDLELLDAPMLFGNNGFIDTAGAPELYYADSSGSLFEFGTVHNVTSPLRQKVVSADGAKVYVGTKAQAIVSAFDTVTTTFSESVDLSTDDEDVGSVGGLALSADGANLYALINDGRHWDGRGTFAGGTADNDGNQQNTGTVAALANNDVVLVDLDPSNLTETQRLTIVSGSTTTHTARQMAVSPDGNTLAIVVSQRGTGGELWLVDLTNFTIIDTDGGTAGDQPVSLVNEAPDAIAWSDDGASIYVAYRGTAGFSIVDSTTFMPTEISPTNGAGVNTTALVAWGGNVYLGSRTTAGEALLKFDAAGANEAFIDPGETQVFGITMSADGSRYFVTTTTDSGDGSLPADVHVFDTATDMEIDMDGDAGNGVTPILGAGSPRDHGIILTPF